MIKEILLTGGPCGGKTTLLERAATHLREEYPGSHILTAPEIATQLFDSGFDLNSLNRNNFTKIHSIDFQEQLIKMHLDRRASLRRMAESTWPKQRVIILYDRGPLDQVAFLPKPEQIYSLMAENGWSLLEMSESYDAVIHMVSAANGAEGWYSSESNPHRYEKPAEARKKDNKLRDAYLSHPHYVYVDNRGDFFGKLKRGYDAIVDVIQNSTNEIERKWLVEPNWNYEQKSGYVRVGVEQHYYWPNAKDEYRVFKTKQRGGSVYWHTVKRGEGLSREEFNTAISPKEFDKILQKSPKKKSVYKTRDFFIYDGQRFEMDFIKSDGMHLLELELESEDQKVNLPYFLRFIEEVTEDPKYKNRNLAR